MGVFAYSNTHKNQLKYLSGLEQENKYLMHTTWPLWVSKGALLIIITLGMQANEEAFVIAFVVSEEGTKDVDKHVLALHACSQKYHMWLLLTFHWSGKSHSHTQV